MIQIRAAVADDAELIAAINVRSWQASYRRIMPDAHLTALNEQAMVPRVRDVILRAESTVLVLECPKTPVQISRVNR